MENNMVTDSNNNLSEEELHTINKLKENGFEVIDSLLSNGITVPDYIDILEIFLEESQYKIDDCSRYIEEKDFYNYQIIVHGLKNDAAMISQPDLSEHAKTHEMACKNGDNEYVCENWEKLRKDWEQVVARIEKCLS